MNYDQFVGQVQHRAQLASSDQAVRAIRATLETLAERLTGGETKDLAAQLPQEIGYFLTHHAAQPDRFGLQEFFKRASEREQVDQPVSVYHVRVVMEVLQEAVSAGEIQDVRDQLPREFAPLFEAGSQGSLKQNHRGMESSKRQSGRAPAKNSKGTAMKIRDITTPSPEVISPDADLHSAAQKMKLLDVGMLPVCDGERLVGMITDRDITVRGVSEGCDPNSTRVRDIMTPKVIYCFDDQDVCEVAKIMEEQQIRRLPVLNRSKKLVGIVSLGDIAIRTHDDQLAGEVLERVSEPAELQTT